MSTVTFIELNKEARTVTLDVDGTQVTRGIADNVGDDQLEEYINALARGLVTEAENTPKEITTSPYETGQVLDQGV